MNRRTALLALLVAALLAMAGLARADRLRVDELALEDGDGAAAESSASDDGSGSGGDDSASASAGGGDEGDDGEDSEDAGGDDSNDWVGHLIDNLKTGMKQGTVKAGGAKVTIVDNSNVAQHEEVDHGKTQEQKMKKTKEAEVKERREMKQKHSVEQQQKTLETASKKKVIEVRQRVRAEIREMEVEQNKKTAAEQEAKSNESKGKVASERRAKAVVRKARAAVAAVEKKTQGEMDQKRQAEQGAKSGGEAANKKYIKATLGKAVARRKRAIALAKRHQARARARAVAARQRRRENYQKARRRAIQMRRNKRLAAGRWCGCTSSRGFTGGRGWRNCPSGYLLTGFYRNNHHYLHTISRFHCCKPCRGNKQLSVGNCRTANWYRSFDRSGWSMCPPNYYIQGLYRNTCNKIYCIEYARCCRIVGSRGYRGCNNQGTWGRSLDRRGWSTLHKNKFMRGLYRSRGHWVYNIEYPKQCGFYSH